MTATPSDPKNKQIDPQPHPEPQTGDRVVGDSWPSSAARWNDHATLRLGPSGAELHLAIDNLALDLARNWNLDLGFTEPDDPLHGFALHLRPTGSFDRDVYLEGLRQKLRAAGIDTNLPDGGAPNAWVVRWDRHPAAKALEQFVGAMRAAGWTVDLGENGEAEVTPPTDTFRDRWRSAAIEQGIPVATGRRAIEQKELPQLLQALYDLGIHVQHGRDGWLVGTPVESIVLSKWRALCAALTDAGVHWAVTIREGKAQAHVKLPSHGVGHISLLQALHGLGVDARMKDGAWTVDLPLGSESDVGSAQVRVTTGINDDGQRETFVELSHEGQCPDFLADLLVSHAERLHDKNEDRAAPRPEDQPDFYGDDVPNDGPTGVQCCWEDCDQLADYCKEHAIEMADYRHGVLGSPNVLKAKLAAYEDFMAKLPGATELSKKLVSALATLRAELTQAESA